MKIIENKNIEKNKVELTVNVGAEEFEAALEKAYRKNVKTINVPGFRKGKAPRKMVEKMYGEGVFFEDAINDLYPNALADAIEEAKLDVVARPEVEISEVKKEDGFTFKALCVVRPEVKVSNYKGINAKKEVKAVTDEDVDNRIKAMRERNSRLVDISDRASKNGDTLIFNFDGYVDGKAFDGGKAENFSLEIGSNQFIPGFEPQLENRNIGEDFDVTVTFPEEYHAEELKGKEAIFKCKINEIKEKQMPALDDEFAKDVSEFDTLEELKADVKKKIEEANEKEADNKLEGDLIDEVIKNLEGDIPQEMYETRIDEMLRDFEYRLQSQGLDLKGYLGYTGMTEESFRLTFKDQAEKQVKIRLALEKIVELENLEVAEEKVNEEYQRIADAYKMQVEEVKSMVPENEFLMDLKVNEAIDLIKNSAKID